MTATKKKRTRNTTVSERTTDKLAQIYDVAATLICAKGYDATSVNDIADAMNLTKAGLYHYIDGKQGLLFNVMSFALERLEEDVIAPALSEVDATLRLESIIRNHSMIIMRGSSPMTILMDEVAGLTDEQQAEVLTRKLGYYAVVRNTLKELEKEGRLNEINPSTAAHSLIGMILYLSRWYRREGKMTDEEVVTELLRIVRSGFLKD